MEILASEALNTTWKQKKISEKYYPQWEYNPGLS